jgi:tryptophan aminotransferase
VNTVLAPDDPYYLLYYGPTPRPHSYFALEAMEGDQKTGLVLRFDSLSKVVSSGLRIGFISGPTSILNKIDLFVSLKFPAISNW